MIDGTALSDASARGTEPRPAVEPLRVLVPSPLGNLGLETRADKVIRLVIAPDRKERGKFVSLKDAARSEFLDEALGRLSEYFAGARRKIDLDYDLPTAGYDGLAQQVFVETTRIPYGTTRSYQKLASTIGRPDSYRLVRSILMTNPLPILIPCHRIVPRKGGVGSYIGGTRRKEWLIKLESRGVQPV